jgi:hypothetical protein
MNEFNEFKEMFMVVGVLVRCTHAIGMAICFANRLVICHPDRQSRPPSRLAVHRRSPSRAHVGRVWTMSFGHDFTERCPK